MLISRTFCGYRVLRVIWYTFLLIQNRKLCAKNIARCRHRLGLAIKLQPNCQKTERQTVTVFFQWKVYYFDGFILKYKNSIFKWTRACFKCDFVFCATQEVRSRSGESDLRENRESERERENEMYAKRFGRYHRCWDQKIVSRFEPTNENGGAEMEPTWPFLFSQAIVWQTTEELN